MAKVLIVDDELAVASVFETALKSAGYEVKIAGDASNGISLAQNEQFDVILLDQMLPDLSGNEALKTIRATGANSNTPISMLSNFSNDVTVNEAKTLGAQDYIMKYEVSPDSLVQKVNALIALPKATAAS
ncbi:MAG: response regulator [Candidatus Levybacteria bacterium]|nr:response regulator [Candidatus Levybacteria bacterium]MBP9815229.1 response regulator [Candidatus Levybacteria bacterium]